MQYQRIPPLENGKRIVAARFSLSNPGGGYLDRPEPSRFSPELVWHDYSSLEFATGQWVCGPQMSYLAGGKSIAATKLMAPEPTFGEADSTGLPLFPLAGIEQTRASEFRFPAPKYALTASSPSLDLLLPRKLDAQRWLLLEPYHTVQPVTGEGPNGACDTSQFSVWIANQKAGYLREALSLSGFGPDNCASSGYTSIELSKDVQSVHVARYETVLSDADLAAFGVGADASLESATPQTSSRFSISERYCLDARTDTYQLCARKLLKPSD
jgi:hypothetical protein